MVFDFQSRWAVVRLIWAHRWVKSALFVWGIVCTYDTLLNQVIPTSWGERFPRVRDAIAMTSGWLPFWGWFLILAGVLVMASLEYAFRRTGIDLRQDTSSAVVWPRIRDKLVAHVIDTE